MSTLKWRSLWLLAGILFTFAVHPGSAPAFFWDNNKELVSINGVSFSPEDYRNWWHIFKEEGMPLPSTPDSYIDWLLLSQEAKDMQLDMKPEYKKKVEVWLKVRALMQLRQEEVTAKSKIPSKEDLWPVYQKEYTPVFNLKMLAVTSEEQANVVKSFMDKGVAFDALLTSAGLQKTAETLEETGPMSPKRLAPPVLEAVQMLKVGQMAGPIPMGHSWYFAYVLDRNEGTDKEFELVKQELIRKDLKRQENELTIALVEKLKKKFNVKVDQSVLSLVTPEGLAPENREKTALFIGEEKIPVWFIEEQVKKVAQLRGGSVKDAEDFLESRQRVVNDLFAQVLTGRESLERHFELVPPLKPTYDFYTRHRLIKELEAEVLTPQVNISDDDLKKHYQDNKKQFSRGEMVEVAIVKTNEKKMAAEVTDKLKKGKDFFKVMEPLSPAGIQIQNTPVAHLSPAVQKALEGMAPGQVRSGVEDGKDLAFIKLISRRSEEFVPFDEVKDQLRTEVGKDRFEKIRNGMVAQLRKRSSIKVTDGAWNTLREGLLKEEKEANDKK